MSDDFAGPNAGIDSALDSAFAAIGEVQENHEAAIEDGERVPNALSTEGLWQQANKLAADKRAAKAEKAKTDKSEKGEKNDKLHKMDVQGRKKASQDDGLDQALDKATAKSADAQKKRLEDRAGQAKGERPKPMQTKEFNDPEIVKHRRELRERFGGTKLSARMEQFERWEAQFKKDAVGTREAIMGAYLKFTPQNFKQSKPGKEGEGLTGALDRATEGADDLADLKPFADKYGEKLPHLLRQLNEIEKELIADPVGASARLAASYGATDEPAQQQQLPPPKSPQEEYERVSKGLEGLIHHDKVFPALANEEIAEGVAFVLERMQRTPDRMADLRTAYGIVVGEPAAAPAATAPPDAKGSKSIHGAPSPPSTGSSRARGGVHGLDDAINAAFGR